MLAQQILYPTLTLNNFWIFSISGYTGSVNHNLKGRVSPCQLPTFIVMNTHHFDGNNYVKISILLLYLCLLSLPASAFFLSIHLQYVPKHNTTILWFEVSTGTHGVLRYSLPSLDDILSYAAFVLSSKVFLL